MTSQRHDQGLYTIYEESECDGGSYTSTRLRDEEVIYFDPSTLPSFFIEPIPDPFGSELSDESTFPSTSVTEFTCSTDLGGLTIPSTATTDLGSTESIYDNVPRQGVPQLEPFAAD
ncbi:hypothetical protein [Cacatuid alphaherpesvirus 2]|uniref:Uncharacterized protein n=1 Tax=Cacatuid alphaherpesvirus 2 TaxID=2604840 RepID=A0A5B9R0A7_9ALPH|nr:hypothetical protein QKT46_gp01 [Cacatuid alphaherpesvirus 2]QEG54112.1 hypothetical protein [Cacatuid alphaherpesvirus 2]